MTTVLEFSHDWSVEILKSPPLIAPVRQFIYPQQIAGEEDALARGALQLMVPPLVKKIVSFKAGTPEGTQLVGLNQSVLVEPFQLLSVWAEAN